MTICAECLKHITRGEKRVIACGKCRSLFQLTCINVNLTKNQYGKLEKGSESFICVKCKPHTTGGISQRKSSLPDFKMSDGNSPSQ